MSSENKKASEGIALLSMSIYGDEDDDMDDLDLEIENPREEDVIPHPPSDGVSVKDNDVIAGDFGHGNMQRPQEADDELVLIFRELGPINQSESDALSCAVRGSESGGTVDSVMVSVEDRKDVDPLDKFLPPPPKAKCSQDLQAKISRVVALKKTSGRSFNSEVRNRKEYRNPDFLLHSVTYQNIDQIGSKYGDASGQLVNLDKSSVFFSKNASEELQSDICYVLNVISRVKSSKYLSLPLGSLYLFVTIFAGKLLNFGGALVHLRKSSKKFIGVGGMFCLGLKSLVVWGLGTLRLLKGKYFWNKKIFEVSARSSDSWLWKSWLHARKSLKLGLRYVVGNGKSIDVWESPWLPHPSRFCPTVQFASDRMRLKKVCELFKSNKIEWDEELVNQTFSPEEAEIILTIPISHADAHDRLIWHWHPNGLFCVKEVYKVLLEQHRQSQGMASSSADPRIMQAIWKKTWKLPVKWVEDLEHILFNCQRAVTCWKLSGLSWMHFDRSKIVFKDWWVDICTGRTENYIEDRVNLSTYLLWWLWRTRNSWIFENKRVSEKDIVDGARRE
ncbi:ribonuclease H-like superfamily protein [Striga asiatica]|uniref:Ribonuclease H-like superfamily protein n=1 Tax=Striga asiatica TaxID=4170 RepID=A0A5A7PGB9_STRAF|nr:ribonuclease H-like superfamily protein [Striga asiatica]